MSAPDVSDHVINSHGNRAFIHRLKCWAEHFDAIIDGTKRADVRSEDDRVFKVGDVLELTRTNTNGVPTSPGVLIRIEVTHVERTAGPLNLYAGLVPVAVLSLATRAVKVTEQPAAAAASAAAP